MIWHLVVLLGFQLAGEAIVRALDLVIPGPVLGLAMLLAVLIAAPRLAAAIRPTAQGLLAHLSLLFVPAGVGVVGHLGRVESDGPALLAALVLSTAAAIAVGALVFSWVARATAPKEPADA